MAVYGYARVSTIGQTLAAQDSPPCTKQAQRKSSKKRLAARQTIALNFTGC